jgi:hypothetical protein
MALSVTAGFGTIIATEIIGGAHHQSVIVFENHFRSQVESPTTAGADYSSGMYLGAQLSFAAATRGPGQFSILDGLQVILRDMQAAPDLDIVFYTDALDNPPVDATHAVLSAGDILAVTGVLRIPGSAFVELGGHMIADVALPRSLVVQAGAGEGSSHAAIVVREDVTIPAVDTLVVSAVFRRD